MNTTTQQTIADQDFTLYNSYEDEQEALTEVLSYRGYTQPEQFQFSTEKEFV